MLHVFKSPLGSLAKGPESISPSLMGTRMREEVLYSLRLWRDGDKLTDWRASLKNMQTQEVRHFANLSALAQHFGKSSSEASKDKVQDLH